MTSAQQETMELSGQLLRGYKYKIEQTAKGARVTVHGDDMDRVVEDYAEIRVALSKGGFILAPEDA